MTNISLEKKMLVAVTIVCAATVTACFCLGQDLLGTAILATYLTLLFYNQVWTKSSHEESGMSEGFKNILHAITSISIGVGIFLVTFGYQLSGFILGAVILCFMILNQMGKMFFEDNDEDYDSNNRNPVVQVEYCTRIVPLSLILMSIASIGTILINSEERHHELQVQASKEMGCETMFQAYGNLTLNLTVRHGAVIGNG